MPPPRFIVVEFDGSGLPFVEWTRLHPNVQIDMIMEPTQGTGLDAQSPALALVRGMDAAAVQELDDVLTRFYKPHTTTRREGRRGEWLGRVTVHSRNMAGSPATKVLMAMGGRLGAPWSHVEGGVLHLRMRVPDGGDADALASELRDHLAEVGADAQVSVESFSRHDYSIWEDLVQAAIGLRP